MLTLDWGIIWTVVNILILFVLLRIFLFKPVMGMIENRQAMIGTSSTMRRTKTERLTN